MAPPHACAGAALEPLDAHLLHEFWTPKPVPSHVVSVVSVAPPHGPASPGSTVPFEFLARTSTACSLEWQQGDDERGARPCASDAGAPRAAESKTHKEGAMERRVRGGQLLRSRTLEPAFVSALAEPCSVSNVSASPTCSLNRPSALGRLSSLDAATLSQLDRVLSSAGLEQVEAGLPVSASNTSLSRMFRVRPAGRSLQSAFSSVSLLEFAEEQVQTSSAHVPASCNGGRHAAASVSNASSAAASLSVSLDWQPGASSLAAAATPTRPEPYIGGVGGSSANGGLGSQSLPAALADSVRLALEQGAMRAFPFSSPEEYLMAAAVLLEAKLPSEPNSATNSTGTSYCAEPRLEH